METKPRASAVQWIVSLVSTASAVCALGSMSIIGQRQRSVLLIAMFTVWVLLPYVALTVLNMRARAWSAEARHSVQYATLLISLASLARYVAVVLRPLKSQPASTFLIVPLASWIAIGIVALVAMRTSRPT